MALLFSFGTLFSRQTCAQSTELVTLDEQLACMSREELETSIGRELGDVEIPGSISVEVLGGGEGFLLFDRGSVVAERRFDSVPADCDAKVRLLAVVVAMAIEHHEATKGDDDPPPETAPEDGDVGTAPAPAEKSAEAVKEPEPDAAPPSKVEPRPSRVRLVPEDRFAPRFAGGASYSYGLMPVAAPLWTLEAGLMFPGGWFIGGGFLSSERMRIAFEVPEDEAAGTLVPEEAFTKALGQLMGGTLVGCYEPAFEKGELGVCTGVAAGRFHARGVEGFDPNPGQSVPWLAALGRFVGRAPARGPFGMSLAVDIFAHFLRPGVELVGEGSAESPRDTPPVGGAISLGTFFVIK